MPSLQGVTAALQHCRALLTCRWTHCGSTPGRARGRAAPRPPPGWAGCPQTPPGCPPPWPGRGRGQGGVAITTNLVNEAGHVQQHGGAVRDLEVVVLEPLRVLAHLVAVVPHEHDHRALRQTVVLHRVQHAPHLVADRGSIHRDVCCLTCASMKLTAA